MPDYSVIADVSATLQAVLTAAYQPLGHAYAQISDLQGVIGTDPARVTIFLFETVEDPSAKNRPRIRAAPQPPAAPPYPTEFTRRSHQWHCCCDI